jgi:hypothetical protein
MIMAINVLRHRARTGGATVPPIDPGIAELARPAGSRASTLLLALSPAVVPGVAPQTDWTQAAANKLPQLLSEYRTTWTLLLPNRPAVVLLDHLPGWRRLYADDVAAVHVREDQAAR